MSTLHYRTRAGSAPGGKPRLYFCCHPEDFPIYFDSLSQELLDLILSRLVDTFFSRISLTMQPPPKPHSTACVLPWEEGRHWQSRSSGCSSS